VRTGAIAGALVDNYDPEAAEGGSCHASSVAYGRARVNQRPGYPPRNMASNTQLTRETYDRLQAELDDLRTRGRIEIARAIEAARALGDLSENGDYHAAKDTQGKMEARIRQLEQMLRDAEVVDQAAGPEGEVTTGVVVALRYVGDDDVERYLIGSIEERQEGVSVISPDAPLGKALMGRKEGDVVSYETPTGATLQVEIVKVGA
jgi:transcription elongation factor GreA